MENKIKAFLILTPLFVGFFFLMPVKTLAATYYVSTAGKDAIPGGTFTQPWRTLYYAGTKLRAGDKLLILGGTYSNDHLYLGSTQDGTEASPITISAYDTKEVIIDGNYAGSSILAQIYGDWINVSNLTITRSVGIGVVTKGVHDTLDNLYVHHNKGTGIIMTGNYNTAQNSRSWYNTTVNENHISSTWGSGLSCARYPDYCTIKNNTVWDNWGEGISTFEATHTTIEDNVSYNNMQNYYISDTKYTVVRRNLAYCTPGNANDAGVTQNGILVGDEKGIPLDVNGNIVNISDPNHPAYTLQASSNNTYLNNFAVGCNRNLAAGNGLKALQPSLGNNLYAYNTFVNAFGSSSELASVLFYTGPCTGCRFVNNIIEQDDSIAIAINGSTGYTFSNNLWSKTPTSSVYNQYTDKIANPLLAKTGTIGSGMLTDGWFKLTSGSPAIAKAMVLNKAADVIKGTTEDHFRTPRSTGIAPDTLPDIGGHEYTGSITPTPTVKISITPTIRPTNTPTSIPLKPGDANADGKVDLLDYVLWLNHYGGTTANKYKDGDFNSDTKVDLLDYVIWLNNYGK